MENKLVLENLVGELVQARNAASLAFDVEAQEREKLFETEAYKRVEECAAIAQAWVERAERVEDDIRKVGFEVYQETQNKQVYPGIGIRAMTRVAYEEQDAANWCVKNDKVSLLKLDKTKFEKWVKAVDGLEEVEVAEVYTEHIVTIAKEL